MVVRLVLQSLSRSGISKSLPMKMPNVDPPAVKVWRDVFRLNTSHGFKLDIEATVGPDGEEGLRLWKSLLEGWWYYRTKPNGTRVKVPRNPIDIKGQLSAYEELCRRTNGANRAGGS